MWKQPRAPPPESTSAVRPKVWRAWRRKVAFTSSARFLSLVSVLSASVMVLTNSVIRSGTIGEFACRSL